MHCDHYILRIDNYVAIQEGYLANNCPLAKDRSLSSFMLFINDLGSDLRRGTYATLYVDVLVLWCKEEHTTTAALRMQEAVNVLTEY